jgi:glycerol kinase
MAKNTYGTGCFMMLNVGSAPRGSANRLLATAGWRRAGAAPTYLLEGSVFIGGAAVQWLRDGLAIISRSDEIGTLAAQVADSGGVVFVPAFAGLGSPHWDPDARGVLIGITRGTTRAHIARATLESIAMQSAEVLQAMQRDATAPLSELRVDGGASRNDLLMQMQADVIGVPVVRPAVTETTALGAAYLAGLAVGLWRNESEISSLWRAERRFEPQLDAPGREALHAIWSRAVTRARGWAGA